jgi:GNAT superfamily N-acetyltransferase
MILNHRRYNQGLDVTHSTTARSAWARIVAARSCERLLGVALTDLADVRQLRWGECLLWWPFARVRRRTWMRACPPSGRSTSTTAIRWSGPAKWLNGDRQVTAWVFWQADAVSGHVAVAQPRPDSAAAATWARNLRVRADDLLCVTLLFVAPQARAHGTGGRLLDVALADIRARGSAAALEVISLNRKAIALYQARGWRQIGSVPYDWLPPGEQSLLFVP